MITEQTIKDELIAELGAKEFNSYQAESDICIAIRNQMKANELDAESSWLWVNQDRQTARLKYKGQQIGYVEIKKSKGEHHYKYGESWNDWYYKDFVVVLYKNSLEECLKDAENRIADEAARKDAQQAQAIEIIKMIKEKTGIESTYSVATICDYISRNKYTLSSLV